VTSAGIPTGPTVPDWVPPTSFTAHRPINLGDAPYSINPANILQNHGQIIQDGLTDAGASVYVEEVELPAGTYTTAQQINGQSNVTLVGHGATTIIKAAAGSNISIFAAGAKTNVHWRDLTVDGNQANIAGGNPFNLIGTTDFSLHNVRIQNGYNSGIIVSGCSDGEIIGGVVKNCGNATAFGASGGHGVALADASFRIKVSTRILDCYSSGVNCSDSYNCTITGCVIVDTTAQDTGYGGVRFSNGASGNTVSGNTIKNKSRGVFLSSLGSVQRNTVTGNTIEGATKHAILVETAIYNTIVGNTAKDCCSNGTQDGAIRLTASANYNTVSGNTILDTRGTKLHAYGIREDGSNFNAIGPNTIDGWLTLPITTSGANSTVAPQACSQSADRPSGSTLTLPDHTDTVNITGTSNITALVGARAGRVVRLKFNGNLLVVNGATISLKGGVDFKAVSGATLTLAYESTGAVWQEVSRTSPTAPSAVISSNSDQNLNIFTSSPITYHTATLTADRLLNLPTTNAKHGDTFRVTRTGGGAFNLNVTILGGALVKALATNQWGDFFYDGSTWKLTGFGSL
jgi:parallel beta-helix repeat protein